MIFSTRLSSSRMAEWTLTPFACMLEAFADAIVDSQAEGRTGNRRRRREAYHCVWRAHLSVELMEGRVRWRQYQLDQLVNPECEEHLKGLKQHWVNQVAQRQSRRLWTGAARDDQQ